VTFVDGNLNVEGCKCDSPEPLPNGQRRECEMPCWQRVGMTSSPCCPDCPPLPTSEGES
jgi:hypothetical protein